MEIVKYPNKILKKKLEKIEKITPQLKKIILNMKKIMKKNNGIGLAANQVGLNLAMFIIDENLAKKENVPSIYINPELNFYSKETKESEEGCLSIPGVWLKIKRAKKVKIKAINERGEKFKFIAKGLLAFVLQHEYDHLQGKLIIDRQ